MARYIKANPKVAAFLALTRDRNTVKDGNYLLWQADMLAFGPLTRLTETLAQIGGIALMPHEAREEQDGTVTRPLPVATDPRFVVETAQPEAESEENAPTGDDNGAAVEDTAQQAESPAEGTVDGADDTQDADPAPANEETNDEPENEA